MARKLKPRKRRIVRLLPLTVTMLSLLFIIKVNEVYLGSRHLRELYATRDALAEEKAAEEKHEASAEGSAVVAQDEAAPADALAATANAPEALKKGDTKNEDNAHGDEKKTDAKESAAKKDEKLDEHGKPIKLPEEPKTYGTGKSTVKQIDAVKARDAQPRYTQTELDLLQNLSKRRDELDKREKELEIKSRVLDATEKRITDKMTEMKTMQGELSKVLVQYNEKQDGQIKSLVKIYENMKPDEAAAIMNELEMPILLDVIGKMSERKVAPVLANMNPKRARDVTQELAEKRKKSIGGAQTGALAPLVAPTKP